MINDIGVYRHAGRSCAIARNQKDESRYRFEYDHYKLMLAIETAEDRITASMAYDEAFADERIVPRVEYFR